MKLFGESRSDDEKLFLVHDDTEPNNPSASRCTPFFGTIGDVFAEYQLDAAEGRPRREHITWFRHATIEEVKYILHVWAPARASNLVGDFCNCWVKRAMTRMKIEDLLDFAEKIQKYYRKDVIINEGEQKELSKAAAEDRLSKNERYWIYPRRPGEEY